MLLVFKLNNNFSWILLSSVFFYYSSLCNWEKAFSPADEYWPDYFDRLSILGKAKLSSFCFSLTLLKLQYSSLTLISYSLYRSRIKSFFFLFPILAKCRRFFYFYFSPSSLFVSNIFLSWFFTFSKLMKFSPFLLTITVSSFFGVGC